jgi:hypothetical protein
MQAETSKRKIQRTNYVSKTPSVKIIKVRETIQPKITQETVQTEEPSHENHVG